MFWFLTAKSGVLVSNRANRCSEFIKSVELSQQWFWLSRLLYRSTPKRQLCYGNALVMLWFYSLVTNQATTYKSDQNKRPQRLLYTLKASTQAIQTKTKAVSDFWCYQLSNKSNYELKNLRQAFFGNLKPPALSKKKFPKNDSSGTCLKNILTPYQISSQ